jgi:hypothetical protein
VTIELGSNSNVFEAMGEAGINVRTFRAYRDEFNFIPTVWPAKPSVPDARVTLSIRPVPDDLLAGTLDDRLKAFIAAAPPGVKLSAWHEASNLPGYPDFVTADAMTAVHAHMQELCRGSNVRYGSIICAVPSETTAWMGTGLDWYGLDIYDFDEGQFREAPTGPISQARLFARLDDMLATCRELAGSATPDIDICEANSPRPQYRGDWFALLAQWLAANGGSRLLTFWNPTGSASGPWQPDDQPTISALRSIAGAAGAAAGAADAAGAAQVTSASGPVTRDPGGPMMKDS